MIVLQWQRMGQLTLKAPALEENGLYSSLTSQPVKNSIWFPQTTLFEVFSGVIWRKFTWKFQGLSV